LKRHAVLVLSVLILLCLAAPSPRAESLLPLPASLGGMGGPHFRLTWFAGQPCLLGGGPAYLILDRRLYLGLSGSYLEGNTDQFMIGYGGPSAGWLLFPDSWFSLWLGATAALGSMREPAAGSSAVFVLEPEAIAQVALGPYSRLGLGASYRWAVPFAEVSGYGPRELSGPSLVVRLTYGVFGQAPASRGASGAPARAEATRSPLNLSDFVRLSAGVGYRTALPFQAAPGLQYWDCNGPTLSLNLVFGVFTPR